MSDWPEETLTNPGARADTDEQQALGLDKALVIVLVGSDMGRSFVLERELLIGRTADADIRIVADEVSRRHAVIRQTAPGEFCVEDLGSKNGTVLNGVQISGCQVLRFGDKIRIGGKSVLMVSRYDQGEDQVLQAQRLELLGELAGGVAHDFNNILGAVLANIGFLRGLGPSTTFENKEVQDCLEDIHTAAQRAVQISKQLLGLARRDIRQDVPVEVRAIVQEVVGLIGRTFENSIVVRQEVEPGLCVKGDPPQLNQMLMNLCVNARDAMMPKGGTLVISARAIAPSADDNVTPSYVELTVADSGMGMSDEVRRRVFEPFFTTKPKGQGTGLGLSTVLSIVKQHGGEVRVESESGKGSTFKLFLPQAPTSQRVVRVTDDLPSVRRTEQTQRGLVLLVDDEEVFRKSTRLLLEGLGYPVLLAEDGVEGIKVFQENRDVIELVILDMVMPNMNGEETFYALRQIESLVPVLITSGRTELGRVRDLLGTGIQGFLQKPCDATALGDAISRAMVAQREWTC